MDPARFIFASFFVLGLLGLLAVGLKRFGQKSFVSRQAQGRIAIIETQYIDHKSKLLLIKRDDVEHLLLVADGMTTIIETGIKRDA